MAVEKTIGSTSLAEVVDRILDKGSTSTSVAMPNIHKPSQILLVSDSKDVIGPIVYSLREEGYEVLTACDRMHAFATVARHCFDLIILDIVMPGMDAFSVCRELRRRYVSAPMRILFITGQSDIDDVLSALDEGDDDYLVKPFAIKELQARVRALLRRSRYASDQTEDSEPRNLVLETGTLRLSLKTRRAGTGNAAAKLTPKELDLLYHLMLHLGEVLSSKELLQQVWGYPEESNCTSLVRWHIKSLREKIEPDPGHPIYIRTVFGHGYVLDSR